MRMEYKTVSITLLLIAATGNTLAGPFSHAARNDMARPQHGVQQEDRQQSNDTEHHVGSAVPATSGEGAVFSPFPGGFNYFPQTPVMDRFQNIHRPGEHMSAAERQRLRNKIHDAGQDIYTPKK